MQACVITYFMYDFQNLASKFFIFFAAVLLSQLISTSLGLLLTVVAPTMEIAAALISSVFILQLALVGFVTQNMPGLTLLACVCSGVLIASQQMITTGMAAGGLRA